MAQLHTGPCSHSPSERPLERTSFYFVIFPSNSAPIVHSNRIPPSQLSSQGDEFEGVVLGDGGASVKRHYDEVPHQTLQSVAFPTTFACRTSAPRPPTSCRSTPALSAARTPVTTPTPTNSYPTFTEGAPEADEGPGPSPSGGSVDGPPWNLRVEDVRTANGELRYHRLILTATFTALVTSHTGPMHSMQSRHAAAALVLMCPPGGIHYEFLLEHFDVPRSLLHRCLMFGMRAVRQFFILLMQSSRGPRSQSSSHVMKTLATQLEQQQDTVQTYWDIRRALGNALSLSSPLMSLRGQTPSFRYSTATDSSPAASSVADHLHTVLCRLREFSATFLSAVVAGLISVSADDEPSDTEDPFADYWASQEDAPQSEMRPRSRSASTASSLPSPAIGDGTRHSDGTRSLARHIGDSYLLSSGRSGRVVIFTTDRKLAGRLIVLASFFLRSRGGTPYPYTALAADSAERMMYVSAAAGRVHTCRYASTAIQWVAEEYNESVHLEQLQSPYSPDNAVLIIAPRVLLCRRLQLQKMLDSTTVWVEQVSGGNGSAEIRSGVPLLRCSIAQRTDVRPDPLLSAMIDEALDIQTASAGAVSCASVLEDMLAWLKGERMSYSLMSAAPTSCLGSFTSHPLAVGRGPSVASTSSAASSVTMRELLFPGRPSRSKKITVDVPPGSGGLLSRSIHWLQSVTSSSQTHAGNSLLQQFMDGPPSSHQLHHLLSADVESPAENGSVDS